MHRRLQKFFLASKHRKRGASRTPAPVVDGTQLLHSGWHPPGVRSRHPQIAGKRARLRHLPQLSQQGQTPTSASFSSTCPAAFKDLDKPKTHLMVHVELLTSDSDFF